MEPSFNSGLRIVAAATFAVVVAITAWHAMHRPAEQASVASAPAADQTPSDMAASANPEAAAPAPNMAVTEAPPSDVAPAPAEPAVAAPPAETMPSVDVKPHADAAPPIETAPAEAAPAPAVSGPKYANIVPDKSPRMTAEPRERPAPKTRKPSSDQTVIHVRRLQTQLMVGALSCGRPRMQANYNSFVSKFDHALKANGRQLKAYFASRYGARGTSEMDTYLTKLSNELSLVSMRNHEFCERTDGLFDTVLALGTNEIETFADRYVVQAVASRGF